MTTDQPLGDEQVIPVSILGSRKMPCCQANVRLGNPDPDNPESIYRTCQFCKTKWAVDFTVAASDPIFANRVVLKLTWREIRRGMRK